MSSPHCRNGHSKVSVCPIGVSMLQKKVNESNGKVT